MSVAPEPDSAESMSGLASTFRLRDNLNDGAWCEITASVTLRPAVQGMDRRYHITYSARYSGSASDCFYLHPLFTGTSCADVAGAALLARAALAGNRGCPTPDTDGVIVPINNATTELVKLLTGSDAYILEEAGRRLAGVDRADAPAVASATAAYRAVAMRALAEFWD